MKTTIITIVLAFLTLANLYTDDYLVSLPRTEIDRTEINLYHITENYLIAGVDRSVEDLLKDQQIDHKIIDADPWSAHYYLVSHPKHKAITLDKNFGEIIFDQDNLIILKTSYLDAEKAINTKLSFTELNQQELKLPPKMHSPIGLNDLKNRDLDTLLDSIDPDSIGYVIQSLQDFVTRYAFHENRRQVAEWIQQRFWQIGVQDAVIDSFYQADYWHYNVVATIPGTLTPDRYVLLGGHHDSIVHFGPDPDPMVAAPGADDNASAVAAAIEVARVLMENDYQPDCSIRFVTFAAEEVGLWGSFDYASRLADAGTDIRMMLNCDMIANNTYAPGEWILDIPMYTGSEYLRDISLGLLDEYTTLNFGNSSTNSSGSDSYAFYVNGFPVVYYFEHEFSPNYHSIYDVIENCDLDYCEQVVRLCGALVSTMEAMPQYISEFNVIDAGTGDTMFLQWTASEDLDFSHYAIGVGTEAGVYDDIYTTTDTSFTVTELIDQQMYYFALAVVDEDDNYSLANIQTGIPQSLPSAPEDFTAYPGWLSIELNWTANTELDLAGYNLLKADEPNGEYLQINDTPLTENFYNDTDVITGNYYYYHVTAVDNDEQESCLSNPAEARPVSLDSGLLVIDDSADGNGTFLNPTNSQSSENVTAVFQDFSYELIDTQPGDELVTLSEFGPYSTVLWLVNSASYDGALAAAREAIMDYLDYGGNFAFIGFRPSLQGGYTPEYPYTYSEGDMIYDYFGVASVDYSQLGRFYSAISELDTFSDIIVDTLKTPLAFNFHMYNIEAIEPINSENKIFTYGSLFDDEQPFGVLNGTTVGVINQTENYNSALFSFPLYYMEELGARAFVNTLLEDYFEEMTGTEEEDLIPSENDIFLQNYPNPFNPTTTISFVLNTEYTVDAELIIYNIKGQKVRNFSTPFDSAQGDIEFKYSIIWDGTDDNNQTVPSGVYLYRLTSGELAVTRKMLLLK